MILAGAKWNFLIFMLIFPVTVMAEIGLSIYFGRAFTLPGEVVFKKSNGDRLSFRDIQFSDRSFKPPVYYGIRITHWPDNAQQGVALDFTHAKIYANRDREVTVTGVVNGQLIDKVDSLRSTFQDLSLSHGHNFLTVNWMYRSEKSHDGYVYAGAGVGLAYPHVEVSMGDDKVDEFQLSGPMFQAFSGVSSSGQIPIFAEYKLSYGFIEGRMPSGSSLELRPLTHHFVSGFGSTSY